MTNVLGNKYLVFYACGRKKIVGELDTVADALWIAMGTRDGVYDDGGPHRGYS
jgi:hypothetical protein